MTARPEPIDQLLALSGARFSTDLLADVTAIQHLGTRDLADEGLHFNMTFHLLRMATPRHSPLDDVLTRPAHLMTLLPALVPALAQYLGARLRAAVFLVESVSGVTFPGARMPTRQAIPSHKTKPHAHHRSNITAGFLQGWVKV